MDLKPEISVIIPSFSHEEFIKEAVHSVLDQTFKNFELIIIDDASKDNSQKIIESIQDKRIRFYTNQTNMGSAATINKGIKLSQGEYITILNSDDIFSPDRLARSLEECKTKNAVLVGTDIEPVNEHTDIICDKSHWWVEWYAFLKNNFHESGDLLNALLSGNIFMSTSNFFFHKTLIDTIGPFQNLTFVQDYEFALRAFSQFENRISWIPEKLLFYRLHKHNSIAKAPLESNDETLKIILRWLPEYNSDKILNKRLKTVYTHLVKVVDHIKNLSSDKVHNLYKDKIETIHKHWQKDAGNLNQQIDNLNQQLEKTHKNWQKDVNNHKIQIDTLNQQMEKQLEKTHKNWQKDVNNHKIQINHLNQELLNKDNQIIETRKQWFYEISELQACLDSSSNNLEAERKYFNKEKDELFKIINEKNCQIDQLKQQVNYYNKSFLTKLKIFILNRQ